MRFVNYAVVFDRFVINDVLGVVGTAAVCCFRQSLLVCDDDDYNVLWPMYGRSHFTVDTSHNITYFCSSNKALEKITMDYYLMMISIVKQTKRDVFFLFDSQLFVQWEREKKRACQVADSFCCRHLIVFATLVSTFDRPPFNLWISHRFNKILMISIRKCI